MAQDTKTRKQDKKEYEEAPELCGYCGCEIKETDEFVIVGDKKCCLNCLDRN